METSKFKVKQVSYTNISMKRVKIPKMLLLNIVFDN